MRALKKFKLEKGFTYNELLTYLNERGVKVSKYGLVFWCTDLKSPHHTKINPKHIPTLIEITGYDFADFYRDIPEDEEVYSDLAKVTA